jgi:hypothetical protein
MNEDALVKNTNRPTTVPNENACFEEGFGISAKKLFLSFIGLEFLGAEIVVLEFVRS